MSASVISQPVPPTAADILAFTLRAEAGDQPVRAIEAMAALVVNRARLAAADARDCLRFAPGGRPGMEAAALLTRACRAPFLFGCWMPRHPHRAGLLAAMRCADGMLQICQRIAARAVAGGLVDPTAGATHWHHADSLPGWAIGQVPTAEIGSLLFYRLAGE
jgi:spore germination cell wall hydrolase CwlJ-like protein